MRIRSRILILCLAAVVLAAALTACGSGQNEEQNLKATTEMQDDGSQKEEQNLKATIEMQDGGIIELELYPDIAPQSVRNFVYLARQGFYDGVIFHRVIPGFMIQGGDPEGTGMGGPGYSIKGEFELNGFNNELKHERGVISMGRKGDPMYDSAGSQFFIVHQTSPHLDGSYAAFGKVTSGMDVVDRIAETETINDRPVQDQIIKSITIEGPELPEPDKL